ncbi:MAG: ribbon-helix-helix protein, CopG family [Pyrinomonadaceae bacterium MAG19_C2-C3]|nr:ribbon-helix-helix protein, CopG family [Pyrinomonadaceae bacterium MAG19_C2-C3]
MKVRTSVTLPKELLMKVDALTGKNRRRSEIVECALQDYMAKENHKKLNTRDIEIINEHADLINKQVEETLEFQAEW